jgi:hypothetical protein
MQHLTIRAMKGTMIGYLRACSSMTTPGSVAMRDKKRERCRDLSFDDQFRGGDMKTAWVFPEPYTSGERSC